MYKMSHSGRQGQAKAKRQHACRCVAGVGKKKKEGKGVCSHKVGMFSWAGRRYKITMSHSFKGQREGKEGREGRK